MLGTRAVGRRNCVTEHHRAGARVARPLDDERVPPFRRRPTAVALHPR